MKYIPNKPLVLIFLLALILRVYRLGTFPVGFHADEVRVAWNTKSLMETGKDDRGIRFPLYYNSFGDYRPTGIFYMTIPSLAVFGDTEFATRFPSALFGALTVFPLYALGYLLTKNKKIALLSAFFLSIVRWHVTTSRATSEVVISLFFFVAALWLYEKAKVKANVRFLIASLGLIVVSYFFYHSVRLLAPIYFLSLLILDKRILQKVQLIKPMICATVFLFVLTGFFVMTPGGRGRLSQVSLTKDKDVQTQVLGMQSQTRSLFEKVFQNNAQVYLQSSIQEYTTYFSPQFFIGESALPGRYKIPGIGLLSLPTFIFFLAGIIGVLQKKYDKTPLILLLISPLPAILTREDSPNLHRAFYMIPFVVILTAYGAHYIYKNKKPLIPILGIWVFFAFINMWVRYLSVGAIQMEQYRSPSATEVSIYLNEVKGGYDTVYVTNDPDSLYPWYAFFTKQPVEEFNQEAQKRTEGSWTYSNIVWTQNKCPLGDALNNAKKDQKKVLVINNGGCSDTGFEKDHPSAQIVKQYQYFPNKTAYVVWEYDPSLK